MHEKFDGGCRIGGGEFAGTTTETIYSFDLEDIRVKDTDYDFRNVSIRWQISKSTNAIFDIFCQVSPFPV